MNGLSEFMPIFALAASLALAIPLVERLHAAWWQWEKFRDFGGGAHIALSGSTGLVYSALLGLVFLVSTLVVLSRGSTATMAGRSPKVHTARKNPSGARMFRRRSGSGALAARSARRRSVRAGKRSSGSFSAP